MKSIVRSALLHVMVIVAISLAIFIKPLVTQGYPMWADNVLPVTNMETFNNLADFSYVEKYNGLVYNPILISFYHYPNKLFKLINLLTTDIHLLSYLWIFLPYLTLYICMYIAFNLIFEDTLISFLLTLLYMSSQLNFSWVTAGWSTTTYSHAGGVLYIALLIRYLKSPKLHLPILMGLASILGFMNIAYFYAINAGCGIFAFFYIFYQKTTIKQIWNKYKSLILLPIIAILVNFYWILPTPIMAQSSSTANVLNNIYTDSDLTVKNSFNFATSLQLFNKYHNVFEVFNSDYFRLTFIIFICLIFFWSFKKSPNDFFIRTTLTTFLLIFGLSLGKNFSFLWQLFSHIPGAFLIRSPQLKFFSLLFFLVSLLIGVLIQRYRLKIILGFTTLVIALGFYGFYKGDIFGFWSNMQFPEDYMQVASILSKPENKYKAVIMYPKLKYLPTLSWTPNDLYSYFPIEQMTTNPYIFFLYGSGRVPTYLYNVYDSPDVDIPQILGQGNVPFIIEHKDFTNVKLKHDFRAMAGVQQLVSGSDVDLFKVDDSLIKPEFVINSKNPVSYKRISPVAYNVQADTAGKLEFNTQYDVNWKIYSNDSLKGSTFDKCNSKYHSNFCDILLINKKPSVDVQKTPDNKNFWDITTTSSSGFLLYYKPQYYVYIGLIVSYISLLASLGFLVIYKVKRK